MSRAGRRARRERLIASGGWTPSSSLPNPPDPDADRRSRLIAEQAAWIAEAGLLGWQREQNRRRASRTAATRQRLQVRDPESAP